MQQIQIDYARNAKKIDVKKLKVRIWEIINDDTLDNIVSTVHEHMKCHGLGYWLIS